MVANIPQNLNEIAIQLFLNESGTRDSMLESMLVLEGGSSFSKYEDAIDDISGSDEFNTGFLRFVFGIASISEETKEAEDIAGEIVQQIHVSGDHFDKVPSFKEFIIKILDNRDRLGLSAKASKLISESARLFMFSEIYSDIRPIFSNIDIGKAPEAAVITHTLKVHTHVDGSLEDIYMGMDINDLHELKNIVQRAIDKHDVLEKLLGEVNLKSVYPRVKS